MHPATARGGRQAWARPAPAVPARILAIGNMYPPQHAGGYELMWQHAMRHARALGHRVRILTSDYQAAAGRPEEDPDVHRTLQWYWDLERYRFPDLNLTSRLRLERRNAQELGLHLKSFKPDVVTWWSMGCMSLALIEQVRRALIPAVFIVHDDWLVYGWEHDQWIRTWRGPRRGRVAPVVERLCGVATTVDVNRAGQFVFNSQYTLDAARRSRLTTAAATVVPPGIEERFLTTLPAEPWQWRLAYIGRLDAQKGVDLAVEALAHLPPVATLTVWGSGDEQYVGELKAMAASIGAADRIRFEGFASADTIHGAYADADVVVFPTRWNEPFGLVPLEAMGTGRPVVTTARGGTAEFVRDGVNALVFPSDEPIALANCVKRLAADAGLRESLIAEGRRTAREYTAARFAQRTVAEIVRVVPPRADGR